MHSLERRAQQTRDWTVMTQVLFRDRAAAGRVLAERLKDFEMVRPLVLAIPCGGVEVAAPLAAALDAELDVVLARKLRAPRQRELALGAVTEQGEVILSRNADCVSGLDVGYLADERRSEMEAITRCRAAIRSVRSKASIAGRSVVVVDDGVATGATMIAALQGVRRERPRELFAAVPVAPADRLQELATFCDRVVCLAAPAEFWAVGPCYSEFPEITDERAAEILRQASSSRETPSREAEAVGAAEAAAGGDGTLSR